MTDSPALAPPRVPAHGNGLLRNWRPGQSGNPGGRTTAMAEAMRIMRDHTPAAARRLIELASSEDERVAATCVCKIIEYTGVPGMADLPGGDRGAPDLSGLTPEQHRELAAAIATVRAILGSVPHVLPAEE